MKSGFWQHAAGIGLVAAALLACKKDKAESSGGAPAASSSQRASDGFVTVSQEQHASWVRNFNPLLAENTSRWPTLAGVHEPLFIYNTMKGEYVPWLATAHEWAEGNKLLRFKVRPEVKWSDGQPFTARDVAFTFNLQKKFPALDQQGIWGFVSEVRAPDAGTVEFLMKEPYVPGLFYIGRQPIVPEHRWKDVANPVTYANENPVGTGPFTEVLTFQNQVYELGPNPHYWRKGKPAVKGLRFPAFPSNDQANLALINGEVDWAANFVPDVEKTFVARNPRHHHYWFPLVGTVVTLYTNTTQKPFDDVRVRKAISMAIDRAQIVKVAVYDYSRPADVTGLSDAYAHWRDPKVATDENWTRFDLARAQQMLDEAGYPRGPGGVRQAGGKPITLQILVPTGWSDWVRATQMIAQNLKQIGIDASLKTYDFSAWFEKVQKGDFQGTLGWTAEGPSPYIYYRAVMSPSVVKPVGELAMLNWHRYGSQAADALLRAFEKTTDEGEQQRIMRQLQATYAKEAPTIPLYPNPVWGEFNDQRIVGFPDAKNPYARLGMFPGPEYLLVLTELKPRAN